DQYRKADERDQEAVDKRGHEVGLLYYFDVVRQANEIVNCGVAYGGVTEAEQYGHYERHADKRSNINNRRPKHCYAQPPVVVRHTEASGACLHRWFGVMRPRAPGRHGCRCCDISGTLPC